MGLLDAPPQRVLYPSGARATEVSRPTRFDIRDYGPGVVPGADVTTAIQGAIAAAVDAPQGEVLIPAGRWRAQPQVARTSAVNPVTSQGHALVVPTLGGITIRGESRHVSAIDFRAYGGGDPETSFQVVPADGQVWRGGGIFLNGGDSIESASAPIVICDLELFGGASYTGVPTRPVDTGTGDGWDVTHKGIWCRNKAYFGDVRIERCHIHGFKGELIYAGANNKAQLKRVIGRGNELHDTNGDCWSVIGASVEFEDNDCYRAAANGVEDNYFDQESRYVNNRVSDCDQHGIWVYPGFQTAPYALVDISENKVTRIGANGIRVENPQNVTVRDNRLVDCGQPTNFGGIHAGVLNGTNGPATVRGAVIERNTILADERDMYHGVRVYDEAAGAVSRIIVRDNYAAVTAEAAAAGLNFTQGFDFTGVTDPEAILQNNVARGTTYESTDTATAREVLLAGTGAVDVVKRRPQQPGNYQVLVYYRVVTATTALTITVSWYDAAGAQSTVIVPGTGETAGSHVLQPVFVNAVGDSESKYVKVTAQAGTAGRVYVSAQLLELPGL